MYVCICTSFNTCPSCRLNTAQSHLSPQMFQSHIVQPSTKSPLSKSQHSSTPSAPLHCQHYGGAVVPPTRRGDSFTNACKPTTPLKYPLTKLMLASGSCTPSRYPRHHHIQGHSKLHVPRSTHQTYPKPNLLYAPSPVRPSLTNHLTNWYLFRVIPNSSMTWKIPLKTPKNLTRQFET